MHVGWRCLALLLAAPLALSATSLAVASAEIDDIVERLNAPFAGDRVVALRDLTRRRPAAETARPLLAKLVTDPSPYVRTELSWAIRELLGPNGADLLERLYANTEESVRNNAVQAACRMWDQARTRELCRAAFGDPSESVRVIVLAVLRDAFPKDPAANELFRLGLRDGAEPVQRAAVLAVVAARDPQSVAMLGRLARTASEAVAEPAVADALPTIGTPEAVQELVSLLPRPRPTPGRPPRPSDRVRAAAARALERVRDPRTAPKLRALLTDPSPMVRSSAMCALAELRDRSAAPLIRDQLSDRDPNVRLFALRALRRIGDPSIAADVRRALREDREPLVRATAVTTLADLLDGAAAPDLAATTADPAPLVRYEAAAALAGLGQPGASGLAGFLGDPSPNVRDMAITGLAQIGGPQALSSIQLAAERAHERPPQFRVAIADALGNMRHKDGVPILNGLAGDPEPRVRASAAFALGRIGGAKAQRTLQTLLQDPALSVRVAARRALEIASLGP